MFIERLNIHREGKVFIAGGMYMYNHEWIFMVRDLDNVT